jgi:hypothetical protein
LLQPQGISTAQRKSINDAKSALASESVDSLKAMLRTNDQKVTGTKSELIERIAEGQVLGRIPRCPSCNGGESLRMAKNSKPIDNTITDLLTILMHG